MGGVNVRLEMEIVKNAILNPGKALEILDEHRSYLRAVIYLLLASSFFSLNFLYGTYIGNPSAYWFIALPFVVPYNIASLLMMFGILTAFGIVFGQKSYPASDLFRNLMVVVLIPQNLLIAVGFVVEGVSFVLRSFYVGVASMEYGVIFYTFLAAILSAYVLNRKKGVPEHVALLASLILSTVFIVFSLLLFVYLFANRVYSV